MIIIKPVRKARNKFYYKHKDVLPSQLGTTTMSKHPNPDFKLEQQLIQNEKNRTCITTNSKRRIDNTWIDYKGQMEYGEGQPLGIQQTHKDATFDDYVYTGRYYAMKGRSPCPECQSTEAVKDEKHCLISCKDCHMSSRMWH